MNVINILHEVDDTTNENLDSPVLLNAEIEERWDPFGQDLDEEQTRTRLSKAVGTRECPLGLHLLKVARDGLKFKIIFDEMIIENFSIFVPGEVAIIGIPCMPP